MAAWCSSAGRPRMRPGSIWSGRLVGSEGTLAIVTKVWVRLTRDPQGVRTMLAVYDSIDAATNTISQIIGAGIVPAALEMMDQGIVTAVEQAFHVGFPLDAEAVLLIEVDGLEAGLDGQRDRIIDICRKNAALATCGRRAMPNERQLLWKSRKQAFGAIGRLSPNYCTQDGVVPRTEVAAHPAADHRDQQEVRRADRQRLSCGRRQHPSDHAVRRARCRASIERVLKASGEILDECLACGGSVTGEHGIGVEKIGYMKKMFTADDLAAMERLRAAFNPDNGLSPCKMLPTAGACGMEQTHPARRAAL